MHQFYVFDKPVMCIFRVDLRCKTVTNTSLMHSIFNTFCNVSVTRRLCRKNATMHPFYVFNTSWNVPISHRFTSEIRSKFTRFARKCMSFTFRTYLIMFVFCVVLSRKNIRETSLRNVLNVPVFVFNTSCNVTLSCCFTSQYLLNTLVSLCKYVRNSCVSFSNASVVRLQQVCNAHLSCRFALQKCYKHVLNASVFNTSCIVAAIMA